MKKRLIILCSCALTITIGIAIAYLFINNNENPQNSRAEQIISKYISEKNLNIKVGSNEYIEMMKGIMLGEYPELTKLPSSYVENEDEIRYVINYATAKYDEKHWSFCKSIGC